MRTTQQGESPPHGGTSATRDGGRPEETDSAAAIVLDPKLISIKETCIVLGVGRSTVYELIGQGALRSVKIGRRSLVPVEELTAYVERLLASP
jgi:excisionase family DNA binding protein